MKNQHYCFRKTAELVPFGWIRHESCAEITANSTYWMGDREPDGLGYVEMKRRLVFGNRGFRGQVASDGRGVDSRLKHQVLGIELLCAGVRAVCRNLFSQQVYHSLRCSDADRVRVD